MNIVAGLLLFMSQTLLSAEISKTMQKHYLINSEKGSVTVQTFEKIGAKPESQLKDESYLFFFKKETDKSKTLFQDEMDANSKVLITAFKSGKTKKERYVKGKGFELITTEDDGKVWGIDMSDLDFTRFNDDEYSFKDSGQLSKCPADKTEAKVILATAKLGDKKGQKAKLLVRASDQALCFANFYQEGQKSALKRIEFSNFISFGGRVRPMKIRILDLTTPGKNIRAELNFDGVEQNTNVDNFLK